MTVFRPVRNGTSVISGDPTSNPNVHIIRERLTIDDTGLCIITEPAILLIMDGSAGRSAEISASSTVEYK